MSFEMLQLAEMLENHRLEIEAKDRRIAELETDIGFFKCCALSGEIPHEGSEPSAIIKENNDEQAKSKAND